MSLVTRGLGEPSALVTRGLGAGLGTLLGGGAVITEAEMLLTDVSIIEELVTSVDEVLAPVLEEFLTEEGLEITLTAEATMDVTCVDTSVTAIGVSEVAVTAVTDAEMSVTDTTLGENVTMDVSLTESDVVETETDTSAPTNLTIDEDNAGA